MSSALSEQGETKIMDRTTHSAAGNPETAVVKIGRRSYPFACKCGHIFKFEFELIQHIRLYAGRTAEAHGDARATGAP